MRIVVIMSLMFFLLGCDVLRGVKRQIKGFLFGVEYSESSLQKKVEEKNIIEDGTDPYKKLLEGSPAENGSGNLGENKYIENPAGNRLVSICNAYRQNPSAQMKSLLIEEIDRSESARALSKADKDVASCFRGFETLIEGDPAVIETVYQIYDKLSGAPKTFIGEILSIGFDYHPKYFINKFANKIKNNQHDCSFVVIVPSSMQGDVLSGVLANRAEKLIKLKRELEDGGTQMEKSFIEDCLTTIQRGEINNSLETSTSMQLPATEEQNATTDPYRN